MVQKPGALSDAFKFFLDSARSRTKVPRKLAAWAVLCAAMLLLAPASGWGQQNQLDASDFQLGQKYENLGDYGAAYGPYKRAADAGNTEAAFRIGSFYEDGKLGNQSAESDGAVLAAYPWYVQSAKQGNVSAQLLLAQWLISGKGKAVAKAPEDALLYLQQAAQNNKLSAANRRWIELNIQTIHSQQEAQSATQARVAQEREAATNQATQAAQQTVAKPDVPINDFQLGQKYENSGDYAAAYGLYQRAADAGNAEASFRIGSFYEDGKIGNQSAESYEAVLAAYQWYVQSAKQGNVSAQLLLAQWLISGKGKAVTKDPEDALPYLQQAAAQKDILSVANRRWIEQSIQYIHPQQTAQQLQEASANDNTSESTSDWEQDHQNKIDELNQEIANHEQQAQQDDADAQQSESQAGQSSGISGMFGALANAVNTGLNAGLAQKQRRDAEQERQQAQDERQQLAELGAEQPPVTQNNSTEINLTRMQTGMINNGQTIQGALNQQENNLQAVQQAAAERQEREREQAAQQQVQSQARQTAQQVANGTLTPQQAVQQIQQQAQQAASDSSGAAVSASGGQNATSSPCTAFPSFLTASSSSFTQGQVAGNTVYSGSLIFNIPSGFQGIGAEVDNLAQGTSYSTQHGTSIVISDTVSGAANSSAFFVLDNGTDRMTYRANFPTDVPSPFAITLRPDQVCAPDPTAAGAGVPQ